MDWGPRAGGWGRYTEKNEGSEPSDLRRVERLKCFLEFVTQCIASTYVTVSLLTRALIFSNCLYYYTRIRCLPWLL